MRHARSVALSLVALTMFAASAASAQQRRAPAAPPPRLWELGVDAALSLGLDDPRVTTLSIPAANFRAGVFINPEWSIEPSLSLTYVKVEGFDATTLYEIGVGALYHLSTVRTRSQMYIRPFLALAGVSAAGASDSDIGLGAGFGIKWPRLGGRLAWRGEANLARFLDAEQTSLNLLFGVSFFTR